MNTSIIPALLNTTLLAALVHFATASPAVARDRFEYDPTPQAPGKRPAAGGASAPKSNAVIAVGEVREVFNAASAPDMAFYVPATDPTIVQVVIEKRAFRKPVYFVKGIRPGTITGGLVPRSLLDKSGFRSNNILDEARVQTALKANPITISVK